MDDHKISDKVSELLYDGIGQLDYVGSAYDMETDQPEYTSWVTIDVEYEKFCTDVQTTLEYSDAQSMQIELLRLTKRVITPEILEFVRSGGIKNLTVRIGPRALSGVDLNEENDLELPDKGGSKSAAGSIDFGKIADLGTVDLGVIDNGESN
jgi:hypothetical protein